MYRHFLSFFWQLQLINLGLSSIALSNYIHPNLGTVHSPHHCMIAILVTIRILIADLIGGTRSVSSGVYPYVWAPLDVKNVLIFTVKKYAKI